VIVIRKVELAHSPHTVRNHTHQYSRGMLDNIQGQSFVHQINFLDAKGRIRI